MLKFLFACGIFLLIFSTLAAQEIIKEESRPELLDSLTKSHLSFSLGYGIRTAPLADGITGEAEEHYKALNKGGIFQVSLTHFISSSIGPSFKYSYFFTKKTTSDFKTENRTHFIGAGATARVITDNKILVFANTHLGYTRYVNIDTIEQLSAELNGNTLGIDGAIGIGFKLTTTTNFTLSLGYFEAALFKVKDATGETYELDPAEGLQRVDFNAGIIIHF